MKLASFSMALALTLSACGTSEKSETASTSTWSNTAMQAIVTSKCATSGCHNGTQAPNFLTYSEADMKANTTARNRMITTRDMPPATATGLTSAEIATVTAFYQ